MSENVNNSVISSKENELFASKEDELFAKEMGLRSTPMKDWSEVLSPEQLQEEQKVLEQVKKNQEHLDKFYLEAAIRAKSNEELALAAINRLKQQPELAVELKKVWPTLKLDVFDAIKFYEDRKCDPIEKRSFDSRFAEFELQQRALETLNNV